MGRRRKQEPERRSQHELRLWAIVDSLVADGSKKAAYLAFARELAVAERSSSLARRLSSEVPDFGERTKRVVEKWFRRGLSGHLLWLIGQEVLRWP